MGIEQRRTCLRIVGRTVVATVRRELRPPRPCSACGHLSLGRRRVAVSDRLAAEWELTDDERREFDEREGRSCLRCGSSLRAQALASAVTWWAGARLGLKAHCLAEAVRAPAFGRLAVAEVNPCGGLHNILEGLPNLAFSDYGDPRRSEDFQALSYPDASFDLMLSSETLEHVPDLAAALGEIRRVLKPGGTHLFTVPVRWSRATRRRRVVAAGGRNVALLPDSFHGRTPSPDRVVFREFGGGVCQELSVPGLPCTVAPPSAPGALSVLAQVREE